MNFELKTRPFDVALDFHLGLDQVNKHHIVITYTQRRIILEKHADLHKLTAEI